MNSEVFRNKKGAAMIVALLIVLALTLIGISSISTTTYESNVAGNEKVSAGAFYVAEAGIQVAVSQIPNTDPIRPTKMGEDSYYWSGAPEDRGSPKDLKSLGLHREEGSDVDWACKRFKLNATGEAFGAMKEIEVQVVYGPFNAGTDY